MPAKTPRQPKPKVPLSAFRVRHKQGKQAERAAKEAELKAAFLAMAEEHPDRRDEIMAIYEKRPRPGKMTGKMFEATLPRLGLSPEAETLARGQFYAVKQIPKLSKKKKA